MKLSRASPIYPLLGALGLLSAALFNGYPLTFWDTRAYVEHAGTLLPRSDRLIGYSLVIRALSAHITLWPVVIAQCLLVAWLLWRTLATVLPRRSGVSYLLLMAALTCTTAAPWVAGQLMPDIFTPILVLAVWLLLEDEALSRWLRAGLLALVAICVAVHLTHFPIGIALVLTCAALSRVRRQPLARRKLGIVVSALVVGLVGIAGFNAARTGRVALAPGSDAFLLGHLVDSGLASSVLDPHCPERGYLLCAARARLPLSVDDFLWQDDLHLKPWEQSAAISHEAHRLLADSLREHPLLHAEVAALYTLRVLSRFRTGEGLDNDASYLVEPQIARFAPADLPAYRHARQQQSRIPVSRLRAVDTPVGWAMLTLGLAVLLFAACRGPSELARPELRLLVLVYAALLANALISANLSGVYDRYESRLLWLTAVGLFGVLHPMTAAATPLIRRTRALFLHVSSRRPPPDRAGA